MAALRRLTIVAALASGALALAGCDRHITNVEVSQQPSNCYDCHGTSDAAFVAKVTAAEAQWENSMHGSGRTVHETAAGCNGCHTSEGFVARASGGTPPAVIDPPTAISCSTCHGPHPAGNGFAIRWTAVATLANGASFDLKGGNLCVACHHVDRSVVAEVAGRPTLAADWGPHWSGQGDLLLGSNGYEYAGYSYQRSPHREETSDGCLDCHMRISSGTVLGGHSFNMAWTEGATETQNTAPCGNCHGPISSFREVGPGYSVQDSVQSLIGTLRSRLVTAGLLDGASGLPRPVTTNADSAGAVWNYLLTSQDQSLGVHNGQYVIGLLHSAIQYLETPPPAHASLRAARR